MPQKWIKHHFSGAVLRRRHRIGNIEDDRSQMQSVSTGGDMQTWSRANTQHRCRNRTSARVHARVQFPTALLIERRDRVLSQAIQFADRHKHALAQPGDVHCAKCISGLAQPAQLLAQLRVVECAFGRRRQRHITFHSDGIFARGPNDFQRRASVPKHADIQAHSRPLRNRNIGETRLRARHERGVKRPHHAPGIRNANARRERLTIYAVLHVQCTNCRNGATNRCG